MYICEMWSLFPGNVSINRVMHRSVDIRREELVSMKLSELLITINEERRVNVIVTVPLTN